MSQFVLRSKESPSTAEEQAAAKQRLSAVLPHLFIAANVAGVEARLGGGTVELALVAKLPTGGGRITASFEAEAFLRDLEALVGPLPNLDEI